MVKCAWWCVDLGLVVVGWLRAQGDRLCYLGRLRPVHAMVVPIMVVISRKTKVIRFWLSGGASPGKCDHSRLGHLNIF